MHKNPNPYHMHIFHICTNDLQNKNFLAEKLQEELHGQTMYPLCGQTDRQTG